MVSMDITTSSYGTTSTCPDPEIDVFYDGWGTPHVTVALNSYDYTDNLTTCNSNVTLFNSPYVTVIDRRRLTSTIEVTSEQDNNSDYWDHIEALEQTMKGWVEKPMQGLPKPVIQRPSMSRKLMFSMSGWVAKNGRIKRSGHL